jgi:hypothetical protein
MRWFLTPSKRISAILPALVMETGFVPPNVTRPVVCTSVAP